MLRKGKGNDVNDVHHNNIITLTESKQMGDNFLEGRRNR